MVLCSVVLIYGKGFDKMGSTTDGLRAARRVVEGKKICNPDITRDVKEIRCSSGIGSAQN